MAMQWKYSNGYDTSEFATVLSFDDDAELTEYQKDLFVFATAEEASKTLTLGLADGQPMILANMGDTNTFTAANLEDDTGETIAVGAVYLVVGSSTANGTSFIELYKPAIS